jgi:hypothetical protein
VEERLIEIGDKMFDGKIPLTVPGVKLTVAAVGDDAEIFASNGRVEIVLAVHPSLGGNFTS